MTWQDALIVCFCLVFILSVFSISVFLAPLWSHAHFCFVSLNIVLIVALTEVKPLLISFVYIVGDRERETERERERVGKEKRLRYWLFCLAAPEPRWCGKKRKTSCVLFMTEWQKLPRGISGLAVRLSQAVLQPASLWDPFSYGT